MQFAFPAIGPPNSRNRAEPLSRSAANYRRGGPSPSAPRWRRHASFASDPRAALLYSAKDAEEQRVAVTVGSNAPDFTLQGWYSGVQDFTLSAQRGRPLVLAFYAADESLVCTRQLCTYSDEIADLHLFDATVWGISPQTVDSHKEFAGARKLKMPLLTDPGKEVARAYGVVGPLGIRRSVFIVDAGGRVAWRRVTAIGVTYPSAADIRSALATLSTAV
jgi:peroxiredoxin Q/BCP